MANQTPDGVILERQNPTLDLQRQEPVVSAATDPLRDNFAVQALGLGSDAAKAGHVQKLGERVDSLRETVQKHDPFTFSNGNQAAMLNLAGLMAQGEGGSFAGIATAYDRAAIEKREERERKDSLSAAVAALSAQEIGRRVSAAVSEAFERNKAAVAKAIENYSDNVAAGASDEDITAQLAEDMMSTHEDVIQGIQERTGASRAEAIDLAEPEMEKELVEKGVSETHALMTVEQLSASAQGNGAKQSLTHSASQNFAASLFAATISGASNNPDLDLSTKDKAVEMLADMQTESAAYITQQRENLATMETDLARLRDDIRISREALTAEGGSAFAADLRADLDRQTTELNTIEEEINRQHSVLKLQSEVSALAQDYAQNTLMPMLNEDMSNLDKAFLQEAILKTPEKLVAASQELAKLTGNTGNNVFDQLAAMADNPESKLSDEQRVEIRQFVTDVKDGLKRKAEAEALVVEANEGMKAQDAMDPDGLGLAFQDPTMNPRMAAMMPTAQDKMRSALKELDAAEAALNETLGTDSEANPFIDTTSTDIEAPAPAPTEGFISGMSPEDAIYVAMNEDGIMSRVDAEKILRENYGFTDDHIEKILPEIASNLEEKGLIIEGMDNTEPVQVAGLVVGGRILAPEPPKAPVLPQPVEPDSLAIAQARPNPNAPGYNSFAPAA